MEGDLEVANLPRVGVWRTAFTKESETCREGVGLHSVQVPIHHVIEGFDRTRVTVQPPESVRANLLEGEMLRRAVLSRGWHEELQDHAERQADCHPCSTGHQSPRHLVRHGPAKLKIAHNHC
ncbi:hypothetical protein chiPu_0028042 [Chiloscyllium punctatum]|uniref:Uncharacterized protein n=1 Tax=Chiloscyllium punctatum TaxID=137246 RepID=A0A401TNU7_CHIPU|nr:hypothetical protein [Chiloscyllium punctatum]